MYPISKFTISKDFLEIIASARVRCYCTDENGLNRTGQCIRWLKGILNDMQNIKQNKNKVRKY